MDLSLTPSIYSAWHFWRETTKSEEDLVNQLLRKRVEPSKAMQAGIELENAVRSGVGIDGVALEIAEIVRDGLWQQRVSGYIDNGFGRIYIYGYPDVIKRDKIYDIKFSGSYEVGKYQYSIQHLTYMYCTGIDSFEYLVTDGRSLWREGYHWTVRAHELLADMTAECVSSLLTNFEREYKEWINARV
jgi:hypothetical protein